jgi:Ser/Thr protein kinase RdoA (MazF antagonist)
MLGERFGCGREAELYEWSPGVALRLLHAAADADVRREREELALLVAAAAGAPVPATFGRHDIDDRRGLLVERVCGVDMLTDVRRRPWSLSTAGATLGQLHAEIHAVDAPEELPCLHEKIERGLTTTDVVPADLKQELFGRLDELERGSALLHGDFQPTNVLLGDRPVVIDWGSGTRGPVAADVARTRGTALVSAPTGCSHGR